MSNINPDVKIIYYGKKELKEMTLYPLSVGDQFTVTDIITKVIQQVVTAQNLANANDYSFMLATIQVVKDNINKVLSLITDLDNEQAEKAIGDLTNTQLLDIAEIVWSVNYEPSLKKGQSLLERGRKVLNLNKSSQSSSSSTLNTDLNTSISEVTEKEE
jgi:hypothetical protein